VQKKSPSLTVPTCGLVLSEQLRRRCTRICPSWSDWNIDRRSLRREQAYFYHYYARRLLPKRRMKGQVSPSGGTVKYQRSVGQFG
jgi:hypothetical protein